MATSQYRIFKLLKQIIQKFQRLRQATKSIKITEVSSLRLMVMVVPSEEQSRSGNDRGGVKPGNDDIPPVAAALGGISESDIMGPKLALIRQEYSSALALASLIAFILASLLPFRRKSGDNEKLMR
eukprot:TRINITY_DN6547_c1_g1_i2.p6 TRINITY_DN6547_c1_g1~~TRINITY_DN6547_c1_g1_i2.p6  ORF type:complete len:126 (-),score=9.21 TRINITY_DN6547_c1_g1_i2:517-894(-)